MKKYNSHPLRHFDVFEKHRQAPPKRRKSRDESLHHISAHGLAVRTSGLCAGL
jgi:hypothetical protein